MKILLIDKKAKRLVVVTEVILAIFLFFAVSINVFQVGAADLVKYFVFQICSIFIPGFALTSLIKRKLLTVTRLCLAYSLGYALNIAEYFLEEVFSRQIPYSFFAICIFFVSLVLVFRDKKKYLDLLVNRECNNENETLFTVSALVFLFALNMFTFACRYKDIFNMPHDMSWWINNSVALKLNYPPDNLFMLGTKLNYHYFSSIQIAYCSLVTGIDVVSLSVPLYTITKTIVMVGAVAFILEVMDMHGWLKVWGFIVILFTTGMENDSIVTYFHHILLLPFGFDIGFAFGIYFVAFLYLQWKSQEFDWKILILTTISWMTCVGAKAPIAAVLLLLPGLMCMYWLVKKKFLMSFSYGISILGVFMIISIGCVGMLSVANGNSGSYYLSLHSINDLRFFSGEENPLLVAVIKRWIAMNPTIFSLIIFSFIDLVIFKRNRVRVNLNDVFILFALITYLWGIFLWRIVLADGNSEMYYGMAAYIPAYLVIGCVSQYYSSIEHDNHKYGIVSGLKIFICLIGVYYFMFNPYGGAGAAEYAWNSIKNIKEISQINSHEMDGLRWLRDNADKDAVVVSDSAVMTGRDNYYYYGIVSERQQYIEGTHMLRFSGEETLSEIASRELLVQAMYNNDTEALEKLIEDGVDYIVQTISITPQFQYNQRLLELTATSENINIYKIK